VRPAAVYVAALELEQTREEAVVTGTLKARSQAAVAAREAGAVLEVLVDEGDPVKAGTVLARLDARRLEARQAEAEATLASAESLVKQREAEFERARQDVVMKRSLREREAVSESDLLDAQKAESVALAQLQGARDGVTEARSRLGLLQVQMTDLSVAAPFDGVILSRRVEPGEWVAAGAVVASIASLDPIEAWLRMPARYLDGSETELDGFRVRRSSTGELFKPDKVTRIPDVDGRSQLFTLVATLPNEGLRLAPGESVTGIVPVGAKRAYWKLPVNAVVQSARGTLVQVVQAPEGEGLPTGRPAPVRVAFERAGAAYVAVEGSGLKEGDRIVVEGNERLMPSQPLLIQTATDKAPEAP
jgi:RND family efflux transporter MFP subunit